MIYKRFVSDLFPKKSNSLPKHLHSLRQSISIASTGHAEGLLSTTTALDLLGHLADEFGGIQTLGVGKGLGQQQAERRLS